MASSNNSTIEPRSLEPGTHVWTKVTGKKYWWPGTVVGMPSMPEELVNFLTIKKIEKSIAVVRFDSDSSYELVTRANKVSLYSSADKLHFLKVGYLLYLKQKTSGKKPGNFDMKNFIKDVIAIEVELKDGDINIFQQFNKTAETVSPPVNNYEELFQEETIQRMISPTTSDDQERARKRINFMCPYCYDYSHHDFEVIKIHMKTHKKKKNKRRRRIHTIHR